MIDCNTDSVNDIRLQSISGPSLDGLYKSDDDLGHKSISIVDDTCDSSDSYRDHLDENVSQVERKYYQNPAFWVAFAGTVLIGGINPLLSKFGFRQTSFPCAPDEECEAELYEGFMAITFLKYFWQIQIGAFVYWVVDLKLLKKPFLSNPDDVEASRAFGWKVYLRFIISALFDVGFTLGERSATAYVAASFVAALGSLQVIMTIFTDLAINLRAIMIIELIGLVIITGGMALYSWGTVKGADGEDENLNAALGVSLAIFAHLSKALHSSTQGRLMAKYKMPPLKAMCIENLFSFTMVLICLPIFHFSGLMDVKEEFWMVIRNWKVMISVQAFGLLCFCFNAGSTILGKFVSGLFRVILTRLSAVETWILEITIGWNTFNWIVLIAWIIIFGGTAVFSGLLPGLPTKLFRPLLCGRLIAPKEAVLSESQQVKQSIKMSKHRSTSQLSSISV